MPIILTTPYNPGDADPGVSYTAVQIISMKWSLAGSIEIEVQHGNVVGEDWVLGKKPTSLVVIADNAKVGENHYSTMLTIMSNSVETWYQGVGRELYEYLIEQGLYPGVAV